MTAPGNNPLLQDEPRPFGLPPFDEIRPNHFRPAFDAAIDAHNAEIKAIVDQSEPPSFENTVIAFEHAGNQLRNVCRVFWNLASADTNDELQAIEREIAPRLAAHRSAITANTRLFARISEIHEARDKQDLGDEDLRLLDETYRSFVRSGAALDEKQKARYSEIIERLATLSTEFSQHVLADEAAFELPLHTEADLAGLPPFVLDGAAAAATERKSDAGHVITLSRSLIEPFLVYSERRDLREKAYKAWIARGSNGGSTDNWAIIKEILALRAERAHLLGFDTFADFKLDDTMAKTAPEVQNLLQRVWAPAVHRAKQEERALEEIAAADGANMPLEAWDWWHFAEKERVAKYALKAADLKPYLPLNQMIDAAFYTAHRLFGLNFSERTDLTLYHPDARAWDVTDANGRHLGLFIGDYFARTSKRSGAWMSEYRDQEKRDGVDTRPIVVNVCNFAKGRAGQPALLSLDDAHTLFHEFGHGLHGLLSDVTYASLAGTSVEGDFVELPSQLYEHWVMTDEILEKFARHYETGAPMPKVLVDKIKAAKTFNQGFATVEYLASAIVDMAFHEVADPSEMDPAAFQKETLEKLGKPRTIGMRHHSPHFLHIFSGDGYAAGYYSYLWSEVLDADAFKAFDETGDVFNPEVAERLKTFIYSAGAKRTGKDAYLAFRGRMPEVEGLLEKRGLEPS